jgi:mono/diheme cytochrome c family protein
LKDREFKFSPTIFRAVLIAIMAGAIVVPLSFVALGYVEFFNDMAVQPKAKTQGVYGYFQDKEIPVELKSPTGTIARGVYPYPYEGTEEITEIQAGRKLINPVKPTMENLQQGRDIFNIYCITCHGEWGSGDGPVVGPDRFGAPPALYTDQAKQYSDGRIYHIITEGKGKMRGYGDKILPDDRWEVVNYVRALQRKNEMELEGAGQ